MAVGELRRTDGNLVGAIGSFGTALQRLSERGDTLALAKAAVELAVTMAQGNDPAAATEALDRAQELAAKAEAPHLQARAAAALAALREQTGDREGADAARQEAWQAAVRAGDGEGAAQLALTLDKIPQVRASDRPTL